MKILDILEPEAIVPEMRATSKREALQELAGVLAARHPEISESRLVDVLLDREDLGSTTVVNSWSQVADPKTIETWRATAQEGVYELQVTARPRAGDFEVLLRLDQGAGLRQVKLARFPSQARALQARRTLLVQVVQGERP